MNAADWMKERYTRFKKAPYIGIWLFWRPALVINDPELAKRILVKDADNFRDRFFSSSQKDHMGGLNIFTVTEPIWSAVRRKLTIAFTTSKLKSFHPLVRTKAKELCQRIQQEMDGKRDIDMRDVFTDYTSDIMGAGAFGIECNATLTGAGPIRDCARGFIAYNPYRGLCHTCIFFFPELVDIFRFTFFPKDIEDYFRKLFSTIVKQRGGFEKPIESTKDFVDALIKLKQDAKDDELISSDLLTAQAAVFIQAGVDSSANTLSFLFYELAYDPERQEKLYQEVLKIKNNLAGKDFDLDSLAQAKYLNACMKETLRKFSPLGWLPRAAKNDYKIDENLTIPAQMPVYINGIGMQYDPDYFPEPEKFMPERFLPENEKKIVPFTFIPFGEGPRNCVGRRFAYMSLRQAIAEVVLNFKILPKPDMPLPKDCELEKNALFLIPGQRVSVEFIPRI
ncbi:cytochrome p450 domain-containing protein [Phthorimaea operculella]|nr:cytochrome p450 domain-containing protein [Phthorimaea operculella]